MYRGAPGLLLAVCLLSLGQSAWALSDPTRPPQAREASRAAAPARPHWSVSSVMIAPGRRLAVVNGRTVGVGDRVGGARVLAVLTDGVRLRRGRHEFTVALLPRSIKRPSRRP